MGKRKHDDLASLIRTLFYSQLSIFFLEPIVGRQVVSLSMVLALKNMLIVSSIVFKMDHVRGTMVGKKDLVATKMK